MDSLSYKYNAGTNQLNWVKDNVGNNEYRSSNSAPYDIEDINNQSSNNYTYDQIGNLVSDAAENITTAAGGIKWNVYGKITEINKATSGNGSVKKITYTYDASGNRISKKVERYNSGGTDYTFYIRDASGNTMSVYTYTDSLRVSEQYMYGSSRLGNITPALNLDRAAPAPVTMPLLTAGYFANFTRGNKFFELSNHLGNVLVTLSDKKKGIQNGSTGSVLYYLPIVKSASDYYPFGAAMPGRKFAGTSTYRYGFNGKENDNEVKGEGNQQDYGMRIYDPRLGRFLSIDPLSSKYPFYSPYQFAGNSPILSLDIDGLEGDKNKNKTETSITIKIPSNNLPAQQLGSSQRNVDVMIMGSLFQPAWYKEKVDRDIASGVLQPKLNISDADLNKFTATIIGESGHGMSFVQKLYIASVYYNLIANSQKSSMGEKVEEGLTNSYAYHSRVFKDGHAYLGKPTSSVMSAMVGLGDATYASEPIPIGGGKTMTVSEYNATPEGQAKVRDAQRFKNALQKTIFSNYSDNPLSAGFLNQGYYADLNKENDKYTNWADARAYYHLQEQGKVTNTHVVQLTVGKYTTFLFDQKAIAEYFKNNPNMRPSSNPTLNPNQFEN